MGEHGQCQALEPLHSWESRCGHSRSAARGQALTDTRLADINKPRFESCVCLRVGETLGPPGELSRQPRHSFWTPGT